MTSLKTILSSMLYNIAAVDHTYLSNLSVPKLIKSILKPLNLAFSLTKISLTNFNYQLKADLSQYKIVFIEHETYKIITQDALYKPAKTTIIVKDSNTFSFNSITTVSKQYLPSLLGGIKEHLFIDKVYLTLSFHGNSIKAFNNRYSNTQEVSGIRIERLVIRDPAAVKYRIQYKVTHIALNSSVDLFFEPINTDYNNTKISFNPNNGLEAVKWLLKTVGSSDKLIFNNSILSCNVTRLDFALDVNTTVSRLPFRLNGSRNCKIFMDRHGNIETIQVGEYGIFAKAYNKYNELSQVGCLKPKDVENKSSLTRLEVTVLPQKTSKIHSCLLEDLVDDIEPFTSLTLYDEFKLKELLNAKDFALYKALGLFVLIQNKQAINTAVYNQFNRQLRQCEIDYSITANNAAKHILNNLTQELLSVGGCNAI